MKILRSAYRAATFAGLVACSTLVNAETTTFNLHMMGAANGDQDGHAMGTVMVDDSANTISWEFTYGDIAEPSAMHIHSGAAGANGGVFVGLNVEMSDGKLMGSVSATAEQIAQLKAAPQNYYVNIHNSEFRGGAVRSQLGE